jgi:elongation factor Ts
MTAISANLIKDLREQTGAGMLDCKKALEETKGDFESAKDWLRTKGIAKAAKKSSRVASEGVVAIVNNGKKAAIIELNSETDFVAKNEEFQNLARSIAKVALNTSGDLETVKKTKLESGKTVAEAVTDAVAKIGENINLRRSQVVDAGSGQVFSYIHSAVADGLGKIGVLIALEGGNEQVGKLVCMHIAANKPESLNVESLSQELIAREKQIFVEQARSSGKPDNVIEKMIEGRMRKFYEQVVLLEQAFVMDPSKTVKAVVTEAGAKVSQYVQFTLGEGVEKEEVDFAAEVRATAGGSK